MSYGQSLSLSLSLSSVLCGQTVPPVWAGPRSRSKLDTAPRWMVRKTLGVGGLRVCTCVWVERHKMSGGLEELREDTM